MSLEDAMVLSLESLRLTKATWCGVAAISTCANTAPDVETNPIAELERAAYGSFGSPKRRFEYLAGRLAAKRAVARALGLATLDGIAIPRQSDGAPVVHSHPELCVSISHSAGLAVAVVAKSPIGIDLEREEPRPDALARWFFGDNERRALAGKSGADKQALVNLLWTRKEAVSKVGRWGGKLTFKDLDCTKPLVQVGARCVRVRSTRCQGYVLSVAYEPSPIGVGNG